MSQNCHQTGLCLGLDITSATILHSVNDSESMRDGMFETWGQTALSSTENQQMNGKSNERQKLIKGGRECKSLVGPQAVILYLSVYIIKMAGVSPGRCGGSAASLIGYVP